MQARLKLSLRLKCPLRITREGGRIFFISNGVKKNNVYDLSLIETDALT